MVRPRNLWVMDCFVLLGNVDFRLRIVARDIDAYERFSSTSCARARRPGDQLDAGLVRAQIDHRAAAPVLDAARPLRSRMFRLGL